MSSGQLIHELLLGRETPSFLKDALYSGESSLVDSRYHKEKGVYSA